MLQNLESSKLKMFVKTRFQSLNMKHGYQIPEHSFLNYNTASITVDQTFSIPQITTRSDTVQEMGPFCLWRFLSTLFTQFVEFVERNNFKIFFSNSVFQRKVDITSIRRYQAIFHKSSVYPVRLSYKLLSMTPYRFVHTQLYTMWLP